MIYVDTSALVPVFIREPKSEAVIAWLDSGQPDQGRAAEHINRVIQAVVQAASPERG